MKKNAAILLVMLCIIWALAACGEGRCSIDMDLPVPPGTADAPGAPVPPDTAYEPEDSSNIGGILIEGIAFPFPFTAADVRGNTVTQEDLGEMEAFFVYYWTTWCPSCVRAIPDLTALALEYEGRVGFLTLLGDFDSGGAAAVRILADAGAGIVTVDANHGELSGLLDLLRSGFVPTSIVIGGDGEPAGDHIVGGNRRVFAAAIDGALGR